MSDRKRGFTLVELAIIVAVIGILATMAALSFNFIQEQTRDSERKSDMELFGTALDDFFQTNGEYPSSFGGTNTNTAVMITGSTTIAQLRNIDGQIPSDFRDPKGSGNPLSTSGILGRYFYLGGYTAPTSSGPGVGAGRTFYLPDGSSFFCNYGVSTPAGTTSSYVIGYYSETTKAWTFYHGKNGIRWSLIGSSDARCSNFTN